MKIRYPIAVATAVAVTGLASAQQFQVIEKRSFQAEPAPKTDAKPTEFKPPANTDPDPKSLTVPEDLQKKAKDLVGKLGSPVYAEREKATRDLAKMGRMALPALQEAMTSATEPEVAQRAEGLMPKAEAEDMKARVACFLADGEGNFQHTLPGWEKFKAVTGNDKASRKLFAEVLKSGMTHQMLLAAEKSADEANGVLNQYVTRLWESQNGFGRGGRFGGDFGGVPAQPAKLPDLVAALFLESQFTDKEVIVQATVPWGWGNSGNQSVTNYVHSVPEVSNAIYSGGGEYSGPIRKILIQWMDTRETTQGAYQAYNFANNVYSNDRKKSLKYAAKVLEGESGPNTSYNKLNILNMLANQKDAKDLVPAIVKCFDDSLMIWNWQNGNPGFDIQLRDYAFAFVVQMADQKPEDYGMTRTSGYGNGKDKNYSQQAFYFKDDTPPKNGGPGGVVVRPGRGGVKPVEDDTKKEDPKKEEPKDPKKEENKKLSQEDRRKAAFKKWDEWVKTNVGIGEKEDPAEARKKWEAWAATPPKKEEPKKPEEKPDVKKPEAKPTEKPTDVKKEESKKEEPKKEGTTAEQDAKKKEEAVRKEKEAELKEADRKKDAEKK